MNKKDLESMWEFLECYVKDELEEPCSYCCMYECEKYCNNDLLKKRYADFNIIDYKECLKNKKIELENLNKLRRKSFFKPWSNEPCLMCKKKLFKDDLRLHIEWEIEKNERGNKGMEFIHLCTKCNRSYVHRKEALTEGFRKKI